MIKDLEIIRIAEEKIVKLNKEISSLMDERDGLYSRITNVNDKIDRYSRYNTEEIAEVIKDLMQHVEGIPYVICNNIKPYYDSLVIKAKDNIVSPKFKLPTTKTCKLVPTDILDIDENIYVYEFINYVYEERAKAIMLTVDYEDLSAMLSEYLNIINTNDNSKKLVK